MSTGPSPSGTTSEDYDKQYYTHNMGSEEPYSWESPGWRGFFTRMAEHLLLITKADTVLDVGCASGLLVQALVEKGADAHGVDISQSAIADAADAVKARLSVDTATTPFEGSYDLITCIEVLEHMSPADTLAAIENMCRASDHVLLSSNPTDFAERTHINSHPVADWTAAFATRGFFRRMDVDLEFVTPWAVLFERADLTPRDVVHRYESQMYPMWLEVLAKRQALLEAHRELIRAKEGRPEQDAQAETLASLRHEILVLKDHAVGCEAAAGSARSEVTRFSAENGKLNGEIDSLRRQLREVTGDLDAVRASERWRVGGALLAPASMVKRRFAR